MSTGKAAHSAFRQFRRQWARTPPPSTPHQSPQSKGRGRGQLENVVLLDRLPPTTTLADVVRLQDSVATFGVSERFPSEIVMLRTRYLKPSGKALFAFARPAHAERFARLANGKTLGGQEITAQKITNRPPPASPTVALLYALQAQSPGRVVMLQGLPSSMRADRLYRILSRDYQLATDYVEVEVTSRQDSVEESELDEPGRNTRGGGVRQAATRTVGAIVKVHATSEGTNEEDWEDEPFVGFSTFFVRLQAVSDAMRLVRRWHRSIWNVGRPSDVKGSKAKGEGGEERGEYDNDDESITEEDRLLATDAIGSGHARLREAAEMNEPQLLPYTPRGHIIDARIMY